MVNFIGLKSTILTIAKNVNFVHYYLAIFVHFYLGRNRPKVNFEEIITHKDIIWRIKYQNLRVYSLGV